MTSTLGTGKSSGTDCCGAACAVPEMLDRGRAAGFVSLLRGSAEVNLLLSSKGVWDAFRERGSSSTSGGSSPRVLCAGSRFKYSRRNFLTHATSRGSPLSRVGASVAVCRGYSVDETDSRHPGILGQGEEQASNNVSRVHTRFVNSRRAIEIGFEALDVKAA